MNQLILFFTPFLIFGNMLLFDFKQNADLSNWRVVDDVVMGGRSDGQFEINEKGNAIFHGKVSTENNGGFSSIRYRFNPKDVHGYSQMKIRLKGDGKRYQARVKSNKYDRHSYICHFQTTGDWQTIEISLSEMKPVFRGRELNMPNYPVEKMEEIAFLIGNKISESFKLEFDKISLE